ncbi:MAG: DUF922 domain-containing protein [Acidobacteriota bacterium]
MSQLPRTLPRRSLPRASACRARLALLLGLCGVLANGVFASLAMAESPSFDHATETTYRRITWDDFRGRLSTSKAEQAQISTAIQSLPFEVEARPLNKGYWVAAPRTVCFFATMNKELSGAGKGARTKLLLSHEQGHFDLTEVVARRLSQRLAGVDAQGASAEEARASVLAKIDRVYRDAVEELGALQRRYDRETQHGVARRVQREWNEEIAAMLRPERTTSPEIELLD